MFFLSDKKGVSGKLVSMILMIIVVLIVISPLDILDFADSNLNKAKVAQCEETLLLCDFGCSEDSYNEGVCEQEDYKTRLDWIEYFKQCNLLAEDDERYDSLFCNGNTHQKLMELIEDEGEERFFDRGELSDEDKIDTETAESISRGYDEFLEQSSKDFGIELEKLQAFLEVESRGKPFNNQGHPTVRFECKRFNERVVEEKRVVCTTTENIPYGLYEETNHDAFIRAKAIDEEQAILQSSFGVGQIMGFNYFDVGYGDYEEFYEAMFDIEEQVKAFLRFIATNKFTIYEELQSDNTNWEIVARNYNGPDYATNNYHIKLEEAYERFKAENSESIEQ